VSGETVLLGALLVAPILMLLAATRVRRAREARAATDGVKRPAFSTAKPWDKSMRNAMLLACLGALLAPSGLYAFSLAAGHRGAPLFMLPVIAGVVLLARAYRVWMRGVDQIPED
jgi:hypothetical protein